MIDGLRIFLAYVVPCVLLAGSAAMFFRLSTNMGRLHAKIDRGDESVRSQIAVLSQSLDGVKTEIQPLFEAQSATVPETGAMDTAIRAKALKMHRLGRSVDQIATTLRRPKGEINMLLKVHAIVMQGFGPGAGHEEIFLDQKA